MEIFLSHPMSGLSEKEVKKIRTDAIKELYNKFGYEFTIIENYYHKDAPENATSLWHLGRSIQQMEKADYVYFCGDWKKSKGCLIEEYIVRVYKIKSNLDEK